MNTKRILAVWKDGRLYRGNTPMEVVVAMLRGNVFTEHKEPFAYMQAVADRVQRFEGVTIDATDPARFLADLATHNLIETGASQ